MDSAVLLGLGALGELLLKVVGLLCAAVVLRGLVLVSGGARQLLLGRLSLQLDCFELFGVGLGHQQTVARSRAAVARTLSQRCPEL